MAHLEPVHVLEPDRATTKMICTRINPTRQFAELGPTGMALYTWQNGLWFNQGGVEIPADEVPEQYRQAMRDRPIVITPDGPAIVWACEFCGDKMNSSEKEQHLIGHIRGTFANAGAPQSPQPPAPPARERQRVPAAS
jgi:hypothetical protein